MDCQIPYEMKYHQAQWCVLANSSIICLGSSSKIDFPTILNIYILRRYFLVWTIIYLNCTFTCDSINCCQFGAKTLK